MNSIATSWNTLRTNSLRTWATALLALFAVAGVSAASGRSAKAETGNDAPEEVKVMIIVNDRFAPVDFDSELVREDLLRNAFYDAARRSKLIDEYDFEYNPVGEVASPGNIEFNVVSWRRSPSGMYNFTANASYWNADGEKISLGSFNGIRTSIAVLNRWDVGEQFSGSAQDAFRSALRKLEKEVSKA